jgi:hypothetical protein
VSYHAAKLGVTVVEVLPVDLKCPKCGTAMPYLPELTGREVFCLGCGSHFVIPDLHLPDCGKPQYRVVRVDAITPEMTKSERHPWDEPSV